MNCNLTYHISHNVLILQFVHADHMEVVKEYKLQLRLKGAGNVCAKQH